MNPRRSMRDIAGEICARYDLSLADLTGPSRLRKLAWPRQHFMAVASEQDHLSLPMIGAFLGGRDHTTVLFGVRAHAKRAETRLIPAQLTAVHRRETSWGKVDCHGAEAVQSKAECRNG